MEKLLAPNSLFEAILKVENLQVSRENAPQNVAGSGKMFGNATDFRKFGSDFSRETRRDLIKKMGFAGKFEREQLRMMVVEETWKKQPPQSLVRNVLGAYLALEAASEEEVAVDDVVLMINAVTILCKQEFVSKNAKLCQVFQSCYVNLFKGYVERASEDQYQNFLPLMSSFFSQVKNISADAYEVFVEVGRKVINPDDRDLSKLARDLVGYFDSVITEVGAGFPKSVAKAIVQMLTAPISALDLCSLMLFSHVSAIVDTNFLLSYIPLLPLAIVSDIESGPPTTPYVHRDVEYLEIPESTHFAVVLEMIRHKTFEKELDLTSNVEFPERIPLENLIRPDVVVKLQLILKVISGNTTLLRNMMKLFPKFLETRDHQRYAYDNFAAFFYIFDQLMQELSTVSPPLEVLCHKTLFDPRITVFDHDVENWPQINSLRAMAIDFLLCEGVPGFQSACNQAMRTPLIFAEVIHRFVLVQPCLSINRQEIQSLSQVLLTSMITYQQLKDLSHKDREIVNIARKSLFVFMNNMFAQEGFLKLFFTDPFFIESFLALVFEAPVRKAVLVPLQRYLSMKESQNNRPLMQKVLQIFDVAMDQLGDTEVIVMSRDMLATFNEIAILDERFCNGLLPLISKVVKGIVMLPKCQESEEFITQFVIFLANMSRVHTMDFLETSALENAIKSVFGNEPGQTLFVKIVHLMAGQKLPSLHPSFIVRQAKAMKLLLHIFSESQMIKDVFGFIASLCQYDRQNCLKAHEGEVDFLLIDLLMKWRDDSDKELVIVASAFSLLMVIMNVVCSVSVVQSFVSLLCQIDGKYLPFYHKLTIRSLNKLLIGAKTKPTASLPLVSTASLDVEGFRGEKLEDIFTVAFWIYAPNTAQHYIPQILEIKDSRNQALTMYFQGGNILIRVNSGSSEHTNKVDLKVPTEKWTFVACMFENEPQQRRIRTSVAVDNRDNRDFFFPMFKFASGSLSIRLGGTTKNSAITVNPVQIGSIGLFKDISGPHLSTIIADGPAAYGIRQYNPYFYFVTTELDGRVYLKNVVGDAVRTTRDSVPIHHHLSFTDVLMDHCSIDILIPLFAQWDLKFKNGEQFQFLPETSIEILESALQLSHDVQDQFAANGGIKAILHLMMSADPKNLTYQVYLRWFSLHCTLRSHALLKQSLDFILMNPELWLRSDAEAHRRIVRHWARTVAPSCEKILGQVKPFTWILSALRLHYWYAPIEEHAITSPSRVQGQKLNVAECRANLLGVARLVACNGFTESDFRCLMSHIFTCMDHAQSVDLLMFLKKLLLAEKELLNSAKGSMGLVSMLQYLFNIRSTPVITSTLQTIIDAHRANLIETFSLNAHIDIILHQLTSDFVSKELLGKLIEITQAQAPELFPICSWMAFNIGSKGLTMLLTKITPGSHLVTSEFWSMWLVVSLFKSSESVHKDIRRFLIKCETGNFGTLLSNIEVVGRALCANPEPVKVAMATELGEILLADTTSEYTDYIVLYFNLVRHLLFFRSRYQMSAALARAIQQSPFSINDCQTPRRAVRTPKSERRRRARRSVHRSSLMPLQASVNRYSPALAEQAMSFFNQEQQTNGFEHRKSFRNKRTSLMVLGKTSFDYDPRPSMDVNPGTLMPGEIDEMIKAISEDEFTFVFGLRLSANGEWIDQSLAEQSLNVFKKIPDTRCAETVLSICSFMLHYNQDVVKSVLSSVNTHCTSLVQVLSLFQHHAELTAFKWESLGNGKQSHEYLQSFETPNDKDMAAGPLRFLKHLLRFQTDNSTTAFDIFGMINSDIISLASNFMAEYADKSGELMSLASKRWSRYWNHFSIEHGPWHKSLSASIVRQAHFKRDFNQCVCCPVKVRRNFKFDDHMQASLVRDMGNRVSAEKQMEKLKAELTAQYEEEAPSPLFEVIEDKERTDQCSSYSFTQCIAELPCEIISMTGVKLGSFSLLEDSIILSNEKSRTTIVKLSDITDVFLRTRFHHPTAIEIFTESGKSYFINFPNIKSLPILKSLKNLTMPRLRALQCDDFKSYFASTKYTDDWVNRRISNFEYLMRLNMGSGRTFNDASQYPILPWVLSDYTSSTLNIADPSVYRDLSVPIGASNKERLKVLKEKVQQFHNMGMESYLYSSGYVCPLSVYLWLIRQEPFTSLHIEIQSGRFDHAARQFSSIANSFNLSTTHQNDFRELIPEFFTTPEFLTNIDNFDLGIAHGKSISNVELPPWAKTPFDFIYLNRKALESDYVSENLQSWIDLVWGEKQRGEKAAKADNIFMKQMYDDIWTPQNLKDPAQRAEIEAILCHVGQVPPQLFEKPHPMRMPKPPSICGIFKAVTLSLQTKNLVASSIKVDAEKRIHVISFDETGYAVVNTFTLSQINRLSKGRESHLKKSSPNLFNVVPRIAGALFFQNNSEITPVPPETVTSSKSIKDFATIKQSNATVKDIVCPLSDGSFMLVGAAPTELFRITPSTGAAQPMLRQKSDIITLANDGEWIAVANDDAVLSVYRQTNLKQPAFIIPSFTSQIQCCGIDSDYHIIVCGMRTGSILLCSLSDGSIVKIIDLDGCRPRSILITKGWGFITVYATRIVNGRLTHHILLYSVNGDFLRSVDLQSPITAWSTYKSTSGFDYIVMADADQNMYHFEAYYLNVAQPFHKLTSKAIATSFLEDAATAIAVTTNGQICFLPCRLLA